MMRPVLLGLASSALGCTGTETGKQNEAMQLLLNARVAAPASVSLRQPGGAAVGEQAWPGQGWFFFSPGTSSPSPTRLIESRYISPGHHSGPGALALPMQAPPGTCSCATAAFGNASAPKPPGAREEVLDHYIVLEGRRAEGSLLKAITGFSALLPVEPIPQAFALATGPAFLLTLDLAAWLYGKARECATSLAPYGASRVQSTAPRPLGSALG